MQKIPASLIFFFLLLCLILIGCGSQASDDGETDLTYSTFVRQLYQKGVPTTATSALNADLFSGTPYGLVIYNEHVSIFEYKTAAAMQDNASIISSDGSTLHNHNGESSAVDWIAPPHFYKMGRILVFYVGNTPRVTTLLQSLLGSQFAGT